MCKSIGDMATENEALKQRIKQLEDRIKRLEDALNGTVNWIVKMANSGDAGFWDAEEVSEIIAARAALKIKEVKP
jgi:cell division septum initiation protein DivIVA